MRKYHLFLLVFVSSTLLAGCAARRPYVYQPPPEATLKKPAIEPKTVKKELARMGYTIQTGAFSKAENAARFTEELQKRGLDATYFVARTGLYKVQFGNYAEREDALSVAEILKSMGVIEDFYIVNPEEYAVAKSAVKGQAYLREELAKAAQTFVGVPYLWGGTSAEEGFDCSGLTMTVYQLNGLNLPRTSAEQYNAGEAIDRAKLQKGDLLFFATTGHKKVSHVGVYIGGNRFIHAPGRGKKIGVDSLTSEYYEKRFLGGRNYI
jgi:cell wall-associated NlpC family hydrolase